MVGKVIREAIADRVSGIGVRLAAIVIALLGGGLLLGVAGYEPRAVYQGMALGALGSAYAVEQTVLKAIPLLLCAVGVSITFAAGVWNVGAEGQMAVGAIAASWLALASLNAPAYIVVPAILLLGAAGGAAWAAIPALLRTAFGMNEILPTLMLNYVGLLGVDYFVFGPWADPLAFTFPYSRAFPERARLPIAFGGVHAGVVLAVFAAAGVWWSLRHTRWGYEIRVMGASGRSARYAGIRVARNTVIAMALSGALAGLAGSVEVAGVLHRLQQGVSQGYGYAAIIVAWIARLNPIAVVAAAVLLAALLNGGFAMQTVGIPAGLAAILQALILGFLLVSDEVLDHMRRRRAIAFARTRLGREP